MLHAYDLNAYECIWSWVQSLLDGHVDYCFWNLFNVMKETNYVA